MDVSVTPEIRDRSETLRQSNGVTGNGFRSPISQAVRLMGIGRSDPRNPMVAYGT